MQGSISQAMIGVMRRRRRNDIESDEDCVAKIVGDVTRHITAADAAGAIMGLAGFTTATI